MNFLCNKQVLGILFILKINFCIYLPILYILWTAPQIPERAGALAQNFLRHRKQFHRTAGSKS
jgi:hypothetical protein